MSPALRSHSAAVLAEQVVQLGGAHLLLEFGLDQDVAQDLVGGHQAVAVAEQHVVDAHDVVVAQLGVVHLEAADAHRVVQREVQVVVEVRAGGDDPVHEAGLDQRHDGGAAQAGRRERAREAHADGDVRLQHLLGEELAAFLEPRAVVGEEGVVDEVGELLLAGEVLGQDALAGQVLVPVRALLLLHPVRHFGQVFAVAACGVEVFLAMM